MINGMKIMSAMIVLSFFTVTGGFAEDKVLKMSTTTSTQASGLLDVLLPSFEKATGIKVKVFAKGTGAAIKDGIDGNVDVLFVHAKAKEEQFVKDGFGTKRYAVMHNDFVILGPKNDPAGIKGGSNAEEALKKIALSGSTFISRGDDSGTHSKEQSLWIATGLEMEKATQKMVKGNSKVEISTTVPAGSSAWYVSIGQGMGETLTYADEKQVYTLSDRGTFIKYKYGMIPPIDIDIVVEGGDGLANPYGVIPVNPAKHPETRIELAEAFANWIVGKEAQELIAAYSLEEKQLFFPDAM